MRLRRLWLENLYNLTGVEIPFNDQRPLHAPLSIRFFCGANGSGKSNALEATGLIFSHLAFGIPFDLCFDLEYELGDRIIRVCSRIGEKGVSQQQLIDALGVAISVRNYNEPASAAKFLLARSATDDILPGLVIGYAAGPTSGMRWALDQSVERWIKDELGELSLLAGDDEQTRTELRAELQQRRAQHLDSPRALCLGPEDAEYAVLAMLAYPHDRMPADQQRLRQRVLEAVGLDRESPLPAFVLHLEPPAQRAQLTESRKQQLDLLLAAATHRTEQLVPGEPTAEPAEEGLALSAVFDLSPQRELSLHELSPTPLGFFEALIAWRRQGALRGVSLLVRRQDVETLLPSSAMSDGEFLYIGRYALLFMIRDKRECLVLLDEPETHFNDRWKVELVNDICDFLGPGLPGSAARITHEVLIATHSALTLTDADPDQVYMYRRESAGARQTVVQRPDFRTFGASVSEISRQLFDVQGGVGAYAARELKRVIQQGDRQTLETYLNDLTGPGVYRFFLSERLRAQDEAKEDG